MSHHEIKQFHSLLSSVQSESSSILVKNLTSAFTDIKLGSPDFEIPAHSYTINVCQTMLTSGDANMYM